MKKLKEYVEEAETTKEYDGYYYEATEVINIMGLWSLCGLKNMKLVHQLAENERTQEILWKSAKEKSKGKQKKSKNLER